MQDANEAYPLISCIMPTTPKRRRFARQSLLYFAAQDYPHKELIIVDEHQDEHESSSVTRALTPPQVRYLNVDNDAPLTIGAKRNLGAAVARGRLICHWDDDDYFGPQRLSRQVAPILAGEADITGVFMSLLLQTNDMSLWSCSPNAHAAYFSYHVRSSTLLYPAHFLQSHHYDNISRGEDVRLLGALLNEGARLTAITDPSLFICVRHAHNVTDPLEHTVWPGWQPVELAAHLSPSEITFYQGVDS